MANFAASNSVFNVSLKTNSFSFTTPELWTLEGGEEIFNQLNELLELRSQNDFGLHVEKIEKRGTRIKIENSGYKSRGSNHFKSPILAELG